MSVFNHLSEEEISKKMAEYTSQGMTQDEAFTEVYSIDCNMDEDSDDYY